MDQGCVPESFPEEHDNGLVVDLRDGIPLIVETLDELLEGLSFLLDDAGLVPVDSRMSACGVEVTGE
jgi:hypothetical protein